ncbi:hypothetical protein [Nakamurella endophytica]|uniref:Copper chaperone PCu(A)C n=1 Tax=Nakamurella endophytica TaxID=1748367 RepID=A0A917WHQ0_9ACTN|nr:hypothetical protein [Nakamurella endophytica]GGM04156.1 hypothetical protein GCM10011594_25480 [Nakamurella endophytica]
MSRTVRPRGATLAACVVAAGLVLSGCAAGQISQTAMEAAAVDGGNANAGNLSVLNVEFSQTGPGGYAAGQDAPLQLVLSNSGLQSDTLTAISSTVAGSGAITGQAVIPGQSLVQVGSDTPVKLSLKGLTAPILYGKSVPVTFTFQNAGQVTLFVPIAIPAERSGERPTADIQPPEPTAIWDPHSSQE